MINPLDDNFFKFFAGFVIILSMSLIFMYVLNTYNQTETAQNAIMQK